MENPPKLKLSALIDPGLISAKPNSTAKKPNRAKTFQKILTTFLSNFYKTTNPTTEKWILWMLDFQGPVTYSTLKKRRNIGKTVAALLRQTRILRNGRITFKPRRAFKLIYSKSIPTTIPKGPCPLNFSKSLRI